LTTASADLELVRAALLLDSDPAAAARQAGAILATFPGHSEASLLLASACRRLGDAHAAAAILESLSSAHPDSALLQLETGRALAAAGRDGEALTALRRAVTIDAGLAEAWRDLAAQLFAAGETLEGDRAYARYLPLARNRAGLADAAAALADNRLGYAETAIRQFLQQSPDDPVALRLLSEIALRRLDEVEAERLLRRCLELAPGFAAARYELAQLLYILHRNDEALPHIERLLAAEPANLEYLILQAQAVRLVTGGREGVELMELAVAEHPEDDRAWVVYAHLLREVGQQTRAIEMYRRALTVRPGCGRAYAGLANLKTFRFSAVDHATMQEQLAHEATRGIDRIHLEFALGKALEDEGEFAASFEHYARGNTLQLASFGPEAVTEKVEAERSRKVFTADFFAARTGWGSERADPIFIVGMPRSGSTLLEQMLASHSQVEGTRELTDLPTLVHELSRARDGARYPEIMLTLEPRQITELAERYLSQTQRYRPLGKIRFVDKMLGNFTEVGLIQLMFPRAAIIDARRHPLGCGFSCYKQLFARGHLYSYDLRELGVFYRDYAALMEHFDTVLPGRVHRVYYEQMIAAPEGELRRLLDYCGLPYEAQCLRFYENPRIVNTISSEQVRQPLYSESVDQWRNFEPWLGPLKEELGELVARYPAAAGANHSHGR
jgi:predicted Zn-dependent protease